MEGKYQAYPTYKDSGVEWLGEVPVDWNGSPIKLLVKTRKGVAFKSTDFSDKGIRVVKASDIKELTIRSSDVYLSKIFKDTYPKAVLSEGDIVISTVGSNPDVKNSAVGQIGIVPSKLDGTLLNQNTVVFDPDINKISKFYFSYVLQMTGYRDHLDLHAHGTANQSSLSISDMLEFRTPIPPLEEQQKIANFLDHETAKIDTLIDKQQQLITLLKEKRQAVISHAVTKGLNPNAPMRDSGVEWLGEVPAHWIVRRLKHISPKVGVGLVINPSTYTKDEGVYFIFGGDVKEYKFDLSKTRRITPEDSDNLLPSQLNHRDLVAVRVGYPGITAVVTEELEGANCASVIVIRRGQYNSDWLCAAMNAWVGRQQVDLVSYGAAQKQFNVADAIEFVFPLPPIEEQDDIAIYVERSLNRFNTLTEKAELQINLLLERRTALISAAVTGKIDVRNWKAA
jgi:type I restriction enzyme S subunit